MSRLRNEIDRAALTPVEVDGEGWLVRTFRFPPEFIGFSGHFPGYPIVPAIVQVLAAQDLAEVRLDPGLRPQGIENAKFLLQLRPEQEITLRCRLKSRGDDTLVEARLNCRQGLAASFTLLFSSERPEQ